MDLRETPLTLRYNRLKGIVPLWHGESIVFIAVQVNGILVLRFLRGLCPDTDQEFIVGLVTKSLTLGQSCQMKTSRPEETTRRALEPPEGPIVLIDTPLIEAASHASRRSPRRRVILPFHASHGDPLQRMLNAMQPGSYIQPLFYSR